MIIGSNLESCRSLARYSRPQRHHPVCAASDRAGGIFSADSPICSVAYESQPVTNRRPGRLHGTEAPPNATASAPPAAKQALS